MRSVCPEIYTGKTFPSIFGMSPTARHNSCRMHLLTTGRKAERNNCQHCCYRPTCDLMFLVRWLLRPSRWRQCTRSHNHNLNHHFIFWISDTDSRNQLSLMHFLIFFGFSKLNSLRYFMDWKTWMRMEFSVGLHCVQTSSPAHPVSYPMGAKYTFFEVKRSEREDYHSHNAMPRYRMRVALPVNPHTPLRRMFEHKQK
jgi:hypothetical protein